MSCFAFKIFTKTNSSRQSHLSLSSPSSLRSSSSLLDKASKLSAQLLMYFELFLLSSSTSSLLSRSPSGDASGSVRPTNARAYMLSPTRMSIVSVTLDISLRLNRLHADQTTLSWLSQSPSRVTAQIVIKHLQPQSDPWSSEPNILLFVQPVSSKLIIIIYDRFAGYRSSSLSPIF